MDSLTVDDMGSIASFCTPTTFCSFRALCVNTKAAARLLFQSALPVTLQAFETIINGELLKNKYMYESNAQRGRRLRVESSGIDFTIWGPERAHASPESIELLDALLQSLARTSPTLVTVALTPLVYKQVTDLLRQKRSWRNEEGSAYALHRMCTLGAPLFCDDGGCFATHLAAVLWKGCFASIDSSSWNDPDDILGEMLALLMGSLGQDIASVGGGEKGAVTLLCAATFGASCMNVPDPQGDLAYYCDWVNLPEEAVQALWARVSSVGALLEYCAALDKIKKAVIEIRNLFHLNQPGSVTAFCPLDEDSALRMGFLEKAGGLLSADAAAHARGAGAAAPAGAEADAKALASFVVARVGSNVHALDHAAGCAAATAMRAALCWIESREAASAQEGGADKEGGVKRRRVSNLV